MPGYLVTRWAYSATDPLLGASVRVHYYIFMTSTPLLLTAVVCRGSFTIPHDLTFVYSAFAEVSIALLPFPFFHITSPCIFFAERTNKRSSPLFRSPICLLYQQAHKPLNERRNLGSGGLAVGAQGVVLVALEKPHANRSHSVRRPRGCRCAVRERISTYLLTLLLL